MPRELRLLWCYNQRTFGNVLFLAASQSLLELLADPKFLGASPGILMALHTWTQRPAVHPHIHALVTGGGLSVDGRWLLTRKRWLLPGRVLMHKFRGRLRALLLRSLERGELQLPRNTTHAQLRGVLNKLGRQTLNVRILEQYAHGEGVATYLARYLRGGPLSNRRLISCHNGKVTFRYRDRRQAGLTERGVACKTSWDADKFLRHYLQHVPPKRFPMVRRYGIYANSKSDRLNAARRLLGQKPWVCPERISAQQLLEAIDPDRAADACCPICGSVLICDRIPYTGRAPPKNNVMLPATRTA